MCGKSGKQTWDGARDMRDGDSNVLAERRGEEMDAEGAED